MEINFSPELIASSIVAVGLGLSSWAYNQQKKANEDMKADVATKASSEELQRTQAEFNARLLVIQEHVSKESEKAEARRERDVAGLRQEMNGMGDRIIKQINMIHEHLVSLKR